MQSHHRQLHARQGDRAHACFVDSAIESGSLRTGEGRDRHRYPDEQREAREGYARGRESWVEKCRERCTHQKWSEDARVEMALAVA